MAGRNQNLLEAFQNADGEELEVARADQEPKLDGLLVDRAKHLGETVRGSLRGEHLRALAAIGVLLFVFGLGFVLGRGGRDSTLAAGPSDGLEVDRGRLRGALGSPGLRQPLGTDEAAFNETTSRLLDRANKYTILAITYDLSDVNDERARETARHLRSHGLPAAAPYANPNTNSIVVMVGAASTGEELRGELEYLQSLPNPLGRTGDYETAYFQNIDRIIPR